MLDHVLGQLSLEQRNLFILLLEQSCLRLGLCCGPSRILLLPKLCDHLSQISVLTLQESILLL